VEPLEIQVNLILQIILIYLTLQLNFGKKHKVIFLQYLATGTAPSPRAAHAAVLI
jgi:hypothetical protein